MRFVFAALTLALLLGSAALDTSAQDKKAPDKIKYASKPGEVTFDHAQHVKAAKNDCKACHDKLWPQDKTAPLNYKAAVHKTAEAKKTSCAACHHEGGSSFAAKGNCNKCHVKGGAKAGD
jgi:c(7)-type cytochrome triheme protein